MVKVESKYKSFCIVMLGRSWNYIGVLFHKNSDDISYKIESLLCKSLELCNISSISRLGNTSLCQETLLTNVKNKEKMPINLYESVSQIGWLLGTGVLTLSGVIFNWLCIIFSNLILQVCLELHKLGNEFEGLVLG